MLKIYKEMKGPSIDWNNYLKDFEIFAYFCHLETSETLINRMINEDRIELNGRTKEEMIDNLKFWLENTKFNKDMQPIYEDKTTDYYHMIRGMVLKNSKLNPNINIEDIELSNTFLDEKESLNLYKNIKKHLINRAKYRDLDLKLNVIDQEKFNYETSIDKAIMNFINMRINTLTKPLSDLIESKIILLEKGRTDLLRKTKSQSKDRWKKRMNYKNFSIKNVDITDLLSKDKVTVTFEVADYKDIVSFTHILLNLRELVKKDPRHIVKFDWVIKACQMALDQSDIYVNCSCADFKYRYAYSATKNTYKYGKKELRPADIRNPDDDIGSFCKHLAAILSNKNWVNKVATKVTDWLNMLDIQEVRDALNYQEAEFPTEIARKLGKAGQAKAKANKEQRLKQKQQNDIEELELKDDKLEN